MQDDRPRLVGRLSRALEWAWKRGVATRPVLETDAIVEAAASRGWGRPQDGEWRERLNILCRSLRLEADLNSFGHTVAYGQLVKLVAARARAGRWRRAHPQIAATPVAQPLIIVGQMRSGTTRIHRLLACDPHFAVNRFYHQLDPVPPLGSIDPRSTRAVLAGALLRAIDPALASVHPTGPNQPEEDFGLQAFSIWGAQFEGQCRIPSFATFVESADPTDAYREYRNLLQLHAYADGADSCRTWLLKAPQFAQDLDAVLEAFPDARLVVLRRDPAEVVASSASLAWHHARLLSDSVTREEVGREWLRKTRLRSERMEDTLRRLPDTPRVELDYEEVSHDWRSSMARIYALLGRPLEGPVERRMSRFLDRSVGHRRHRYRAADFGLSEGQIAEAFA
ncbi:sulfotransferase [Sphingomonas sp. HDW15A]|uniref:sulfotransferase family protein n=1 Tax=Sphingomonas sp. HDW15A TaxID=2714942 RepID=UPI0014075002|nr:sulfotransferase [Sphingomonas sp. HDW15A]QIK95595.1 sulfotransferase [Sphingomonas sp. HDW15A]